MNVSEPIRRHALLTPDAVAYAGAYGAVATYAVLERSINAVAHRLRDLGLVPGQTAVVATNDLYKHIVVTLALARLGIAHAPVTLPAHLTDVAILDGGAQGNGCAKTVSLDDLSPVGLLTRDHAAPVASHGDGAAVLMRCPSYDTTGRPRFMPISHDLALRRADSRALGLERIAGGRGTAAARQACYIVPGSSYGFSSLMIVLCGGGAVLEPAIDARELPSWLIRSRVNYMVTSPSSLQKVAEALPALRGPNALETIEVGGRLPPAPVYELARQRLCANIIVNYDLTESGRVAWAPATVVQRNPGAAGYAYPGVEIQIVGEDDTPVAAGREGIVRIRSEQNASGYDDDAEASAAVFRSGWVYPGDCGVLAPDGLLRITGRVDEIVGRGGERISPHALEAAMMALGEVREVAVFGITDDGGTSHVCAAVVDAGPIDANAFHARCREQLGVAAPAFIMHVRELPRNANGKVLRSELVRIALESSGKQRVPG